ncbi:MAG: hypothetical protein Q4G33_13115 [bacterium]|nr:hypothetical protein [bacterium]
MNQAVKFAIDTIIVAMIPKFEGILNNKISNKYISCFLAAAIAVFLILIIEKVISAGRNRKLNGEWFEYIKSTPMQPFSICRVEENFFTGRKKFSGINYNSSMDLNSRVEFESPEFMEIENGFIYTIKSDAQEPINNKIGIGRYAFSSNMDFISMDGYFIDVNSRSLTVKPVVMFKANRKFYEKIGLDYGNRKGLSKKEKWRKFKKFLRDNKLY